MTIKFRIFKNKLKNDLSNKNKKQILLNINILILININSNACVYTNRTHANIIKGG